MGDNVLLGPWLLRVPEPDDAGVPHGVPHGVPAPPHRAHQVRVLPGPGPHTLPDSQEVTI